MVNAIAIPPPCRSGEHVRDAPRMSFEGLANHGIADDHGFMPSKALHERGELRGVASYVICGASE